MKKKQGLYLAIAAALLVVIAGIYLMSQGAEEVPAVTAKTSSISVSVEDTALVQAAEDYHVFSTQNARLSHISIEIGQMVEKGQIIMQLENPELQLQLSESRSQLAQSQSSAASARAGIKRLERQLQDARSNVARIQKLLHQGAVSKSEYEKAVLLADTLQESLNEQAAHQAALESQVKGIQESISKLSELEKELQLYSPIQGVILRIPVESGQPVMAGTLLASIAAVQDLEIKAEILSDDLADIAIGQKVRISAPVLGEVRLEGKVIRIYPAAEEKMSALGVIQRRVPIIISIEEQANLKPGYEVRVAIETRHLDQVIIIPLESVRKNGQGQEEVMLIQNNRIKYQEVETGISDANNVEIKQGIKAGDMLVRDSNRELKEHSKVNPYE